jgi:hypothetical protein
MMRGFGIVDVLALVTAAGWLGKLTLPYPQAVRVRNAFLLRRGRPEDFQWTPATVPPDFYVERKRPPAEIEQAAQDARSRVTGDWPLALALVGLLVRHSTREGDAIQADLATTYAGIVSGAGYCSDHVRVYLAAASAVGIFCRQWAFSFDGFAGHGHTFVEVYDRQQAKWRFLDVHNNVYAVIAGTEEPLAALELRNALLAAPTSIEFRRAGPGRLGFDDFDKLLDYYRRGAPQWYLWWGNDVITRDSSGLRRGLQKISRHLAHAVGSALDLPPLVVIVSEQNEVEIARMESLRRNVIGTVILIVILVTLFAVQLAW